MELIVSEAIKNFLEEKIANGKLASENMRDIKEELEQMDKQIPWEEYFG